MAVEAQVPDKAPSKDGSSFNQLLGIKGAAQETVGFFLLTFQCTLLNGLCFMISL